MQGGNNHERCLVVGSLLFMGANPEALDNGGFTPLQRAIRIASEAEAAGEDEDEDEEDEEDRQRKASQMLQCAVFLAHKGADPLPHPTDAAVLMPAPVAKAALSRLAELQPEAAAAACAPGAVYTSTEIATLVSSRAASLRAAEALAHSGDPIRKLRAAEETGGLFSERRKRSREAEGLGRRTQQPQWGKPELMGILAIARHGMLMRAEAEAAAAAAAAAAAVVAARERQEVLVAARLPNGALAGGGLP